MLIISKKKAGVKHDYAKDIRNYIEKRMEGIKAPSGKYCDAEADLANWMKFQDV